MHTNDKAAKRWAQKNIGMWRKTHRDTSVTKAKLTEVMRETRHYKEFFGSLSDAVDLLFDEFQRQQEVSGKRHSARYISIAKKRREIKLNFNSDGLCINDGEQLGYNAFGSHFIIFEMDQINEEIITGVCRDKVVHITSRKTGIILKTFIVRQQLYCMDVSYIAAEFLSRGDKAIEERIMATMKKYKGLLAAASLHYRGPRYSVDFTVLGNSTVVTTVRDSVSPYEETRMHGSYIEALTAVSDCTGLHIDESEDRIADSLLENFDSVTELSDDLQNLLRRRRPVEIMERVLLAA